MRTLSYGIVSGRGGGNPYQPISHLPGFAVLARDGSVSPAMTVSIASPSIGARERDAVTAVLESGNLAGGDIVERFEEEFASFVGTTEGIATSNGTTALHAALEAVGVSEGSKVVTTPFSFVATANAIKFAGGQPVFADVDPETFNLDPQAVERTLRSTDGIEAILVVHLYGLPAAMDHLGDIAETYDVPIVEDAAQAHGARFRDSHVGSIGEIGCFSFYPTKNMTTGEGGMITTDRSEIARRCRRFIDHGRGSERYEHVEVGHNFRMTDIAAAIGRVQLDRLPTFVASRRRNAQSLTEGLEATRVSTPVEPPRTTHCYHQYTIRDEDREAIKSALTENDIESRVYYPQCIHHTPAYEGNTAVSPHAERASNEVLSLPVHPGVTERDIAAIVDTISSVAG